MRSLAVDILAVSGVALVLGVLRLGAPLFWFDEGLTAYEIDLPTWELAERQFHFLYLVGLKPWAAVAGQSEWALRIPSVFGLVLTCAFTVTLGRRLFDRRVAVTSGLLVATSPFMIKWSQQARGYTLLAALGVLATLLLLRALERGSRSAWAVYGAALSLAVVWHPVGAVLLAPAHAVLGAQRRQRLLPHGLLAGVVIISLAFPWLVIAAMRSVGDEHAIGWLKFPTAEVATRTLLDVSGAAGVGLALAVSGLLVLRRDGRGDQGMWLGVWALSPFAVALLISLVRPIFLDRYLIVAAPAFALLGAAAIVGVTKRARIFAVTAVVVAEMRSSSCHV